MIEVGKILLAIALLVVGLQEVLFMKQQSVSMSDALPAIVLSVALCGLLVWSALKKKAEGYKPSKGWMIFWSVIGLLCLLSILGNLMTIARSLGQAYRTDSIEHSAAPRTLAEREPVCRTGRFSLGGVGDMTS